MGEAQRKLMAQGEAVAFDFAAVKGFTLSRSTRDALALLQIGASSDSVETKAVRHTIVNVVNAKFPQGMGRVDGKIYAAWLELLEGEAAEGTVTRGMIEWLHKHAADDDVKLPPALVQIREGIVEYLDRLKGEQEK